MWVEHGKMDGAVEGQEWRCVGMLVDGTTQNWAKLELC